jgi:putative membrane protein
MRKLAILLGGALALAACSTTPRPAAVVDVNNPLLAPGYMAQAASADQAEIQSGQLALQASQNPGVRQFANMIITDHTRSSQMIAAAAASAHLAPPPPTILPAQQAMLDQLRAAGTGPAFDMAFQQAQIQAHQQALALHQNYAQGGDVPALKAAAAQIVPVVQMHLLAAQALQVAAPPPPPPAPPPPPPARRSGERG